MLVSASVITVAMATASEVDRLPANEAKVRRKWTVRLLSARTVRWELVRTRRLHRSGQWWRRKQVTSKLRRARRTTEPGITSCSTTNREVTDTRWRPTSSSRCTSDPSRPGRTRNGVFLWLHKANVPMLRKLPRSQCRGLRGAGDGCGEGGGSGGIASQKGDADVRRQA